MKLLDFGAVIAVIIWTVVVITIVASEGCTLKGLKTDEIEIKEITVEKTI